ncbi:MAG: hypothetical protein NT022_10775, partial [Deltaproteobacteria bacterium]|nr:hypothetical protein [Deltaproteobacteria bacterium]
MLSDFGGKMRILTRKGKITEFKSAAVVVPYFEDVKELQGAVKLLDEETGGMIMDIIATGDFKGTLNQVSVLYTRGVIPAKRIVLAGAGKKTDFTLEKLRSVFATAAKHIRSLKLKECFTSLDFIESKESIEHTVQGVVEGAVLGLYQYTNYKTVDKDKKGDPKEFTIVEERENICEIIRSAAESVEIVTKAVFFARDMVSAPGNEMTPT